MFGNNKIRQATQKLDADGTIEGIMDPAPFMAYKEVRIKTKNNCNFDIDKERWQK